MTNIKHGKDIYYEKNLDPRAGPEYIKREREICQCGICQAVVPETAHFCSNCGEAFTYTDKKKLGRKSDKILVKGYAINGAKLYLEGIKQGVKTHLSTYDEIQEAELALQHAIDYLDIKFEKL